MPNHDPGADPDPDHHGIQVRLDDRLAFVVLAFVYQVEVFLKALIDIRLGGGLLACLVKDALRSHRADQLSVLVDIHERPLGFLIRVVVLGVGAADEVVAADLHVVAITEFGFFVLVQG